MQYLLLVVMALASQLLRIQHVSGRRFGAGRRFFWFDRSRRPVETHDVSKDRDYEKAIGGYDISICSIQGYRSYMEDEFVTAPDVCGIFDGHGGNAVSQYLRFNIYGVLQSYLTDRSIDDYVRSMEKSIYKVDREICKINHWSFQGSTCCVIWIHSSNHAIIANVGDSRAILSRNHTGLDITKDHKPHDEEELVRIENAGGMVTWEAGGIPRVNGNLALSRSIGDRSERPAVCATPDLFVLDITNQDEFIVLATDGLWDVMSTTDVTTFIHNMLESMEVDDTIERSSIATLVVEEALRRGSFDNITVIILWLK